MYRLKFTTVTGPTLFSLVSFYTGRDFAPKIWRLSAKFTFYLADGRKVRMIDDKTNHKRMKAPSAMEMAATVRDF